MEDRIFKERQSRELSFRARNKEKRRRERLYTNAAPKFVPQGQFAPMVRVQYHLIFMPVMVCGQNTIQKTW